MQVNVSVCVRSNRSDIPIPVFVEGKVIHIDRVTKQFVVQLVNDTSSVRFIVTLKYFNLS